MSFSLVMSLSSNWINMHLLLIMCLGGGTGKMRCWFPLCTDFQERKTAAGIAGAESNRSRSIIRTWRSPEWDLQGLAHSDGADELSYLNKSCLNAKSVQYVQLSASVIIIHRHAFRQLEEVLQNTCQVIWLYNIKLCSSCSDPLIHALHCTYRLDKCYLCRLFYMSKWVFKACRGLIHMWPIAK